MASMFVDVEAAEDRAPARQPAPVVIIRGQNGGARPGAGRPAANPQGLPELDKKGKFWHFTVFYTEQEEKDGYVAKIMRFFEETMIEVCTYVVYGEEVTQTNLLHLQGYMELKNI
jgi:hypothetical protein